MVIFHRMDMKHHVVDDPRNYHTDVRVKHNLIGDFGILSSKPLHSYLLLTIEIAGLRIEMVIFNSYISLPGNILMNSKMVINPDFVGDIFYSYGFRHWDVSK